MSKESSQACEWVAAAALDSARERRAASSLRSSRAGEEEEEEEELVVDPVLAAAGMGQWCATMLHLIRTLSEELIPEAALLPHMERSESGGDGGRRIGFISSVRQNTPLQLSEVIQLLQQQSVRGDGRRGESLIHCLTQLTVRKIL